LESSYAFWAVLFALAIKCLVFFYCYLNFDFSRYGNETMFSIWNRWDAAHFLRIAEHYYDPEGLPKSQFEMLSHFPPLFPLLIRFFSFAFQVSYLHAALLLSSAANLAATYLLAHLAYFEFRSGRAAFLTAAFFNLYPLSYYTLAPYADSSYLFVVIAFFLMLRGFDRLFAPAILAGCAVLIRLLGLSLLPVFALRLVLGIRDRVDPLWRVVLFVFPIGALAGYMVLNQYIWNDSFFFFHPPSGGTAEGFSFPFSDTFRGLSLLLRKSFLGTLDSSFMETLGWGALFTTFVLALTLWSALQQALPWEYWFYGLCYIVSYSCYYGGKSDARLSFGVFPAFLVLGRIRNPYLIGFLLILFTGLQCFFAERFTQGGWAF
jgi:hypothetical protein